MWQLLFSVLHMSSNALLTSFCVESEWQSYAMKKKTLRVGSPVGSQRSTYFLSLPWRYGLPLMATFTILHWTVSQSFFLIVLSEYYHRVYRQELLFLGCSPRPLITSKSLRTHSDTMLSSNSYSHLVVAWSGFCGHMFPYFRGNIASWWQLQRYHKRSMPQITRRRQRSARICAMG